MADTAPPTPAPPPTSMPGVLRLHLDRARQLEVHWADGKQTVYPLGLLRSHCPCASCRKFREEQASRKSLLNLLPGNYAGELRAEKAEMVGNYALRIDWSDGHGSGIYSFDYLWTLRPG